MINLKFTKRCCIDSITLIENYEKAINDTTQCWVLHHRKEIDEGLSVKQLIEQNLYFHRPPTELIFLTKSEHISLHHKGKKIPEEQIETQRRKILEYYSKSENREKVSVLTKQAMQRPEVQAKLGSGTRGIHLNKEQRKKRSDANKGKPSPIEGKHRVYDNKEHTIWHFEY